MSNKQEIIEEIKGILGGVEDIAEKERKRFLALLSAVSLDIPEPPAQRKRESAFFLSSAVGKALATAAAVVFVVTGVIIYSRPSTQSARVTSCKGKVFLENSNGIWYLNGSRHPSQGDRIITGAQGSVVLELASGITLSIAPNSDVVLTSLKKRGAAVESASLLTMGTVRYSIKKLSRGSSVCLLTPTSSAVVRGTIFSASVSDRDRSYFEVYKGKILVKKRSDIFREKLSSRDLADLDRLYEKWALVVSEKEGCNIISDREAIIQYHSLNALVEKYPLLEPQLCSGSLFTGRLERHFLRADKENYRAKGSSGRTSKNISVKGAGYGVHPGDYLFPVRKGKVISLSRRGTVRLTRQGRMLWKKDFHEAVTPVMRNDVLFLVTSRGKVTALDLYKGSVLWQKETGLPHGKLTVTEGYLFLVSGHILYTFSQKGPLLWVASMGSDITSGPIVHGTSVYMGTREGVFQGLYAASGLKQFRENLKSIPRVMAPGRDTIVIGTDDGMIVGYSTVLREKIWWRRVGSPLSTLIFSGDYYGVSLKGDVYRMTENGSMRWRTHLDSVITGKPLCQGKSLYLRSDKSIFVLDRGKGSLAWSLVVPDLVKGELMVNHSSLAFMTSRRGLVSLKR